MYEEVFVDLGIIIFISVLLAGLMRMLKQPLIIGYILTGVIVSPYFLNLVHYTDTIAAFAHTGVALLLFMVGLNLKPTVIREVGKVSLITGIGQIVFTSILGFLICEMLGFSFIESLYISVAITFSSTIIIMKLLSDKGEIDALYSKIAIGFLIVQDLVAILLLILVTYSSISTNLDFTFERMLLIFSVILSVVIVSRYIPNITSMMASSQELLLMFSIAWCFILASIFHTLGLSMEIGALIAGISISTSPYKPEIASKVKLLRDFFLVLFFVLLGTQMVFTSVFENLISIIVLSLFILIGNPLVVLVLMGILGYTRRTSFLAALTVAQISEFSLILISLGIKAGHLGTEILSIVTVVGIITIAISSYFIIYSNNLYLIFSDYLRMFERKGKKVDETGHKFVKDAEAVLFGYNRIGFDILNALNEKRINTVVVDYNPEIIRDAERKGIPCIYGDAGDVELLDEIKVSDKKMVISTVPDHEVNLLLIHWIREKNPNTVIIVVAHRIDDALEFYREGATYVLMPHFVGGHYLSLMIDRFGFDSRKYFKERSKHIKSLLTKKSLGHEHPLHDKH